MINWFLPRFPRQSREQWSLFNKSGWDYCISSYKNMKLYLFLIPYQQTKQKPNMYKRPNVRAKLSNSKKKTGVSLCDLGLDNGFLEMKPKIQATKRKIHKLDYIKINNSCAANYTIKKINRQHTGYEKIFPGHIWEEAGVQNKELLQLNNESKF